MILLWPRYLPNPLNYLPGPHNFIPALTILTAAILILVGLFALCWFIDLMTNAGGGTKVVLEKDGGNVHVGLNDYAFRPAKDRAEIDAAMVLLHDNYVSCGYIKPSDHVGKWEGPSQTFLVLCNNAIVATDTLFLDGSKGLPCDRAFTGVLRELRQTHKVCEAGMFASIGRIRPHVLLSLMRLVEDGAKAAGCDMLLTVVHPHHVKFYTRLLAFHDVARRADYPGLSNAPAVLLATERWQHEGKA